MTYDNFEKARELHQRMEYIDSLMDLIKTSKESSATFASNNRALAAIRITSMDGPYVVTDCEVINHERLDDDIANDIIHLLDTKRQKIEAEFEAI